MKNREFDPKQFLGVDELSVLETQLIRGGKDETKCKCKCDCDGKDKKI